MINPMIEQVRKNPASGGFGINQIFSIGVLVISLCVSTLAVDLPFYFAAQNQLQTAVNAAALAGAANLPDGNDEAVEAALDMAAQNPVTNKILEESNLTFDSNGNVFEVRGEVEVDTIMAKILCGLTGVVDTVAGDGDGGEGEGESSGMSCNSMKVGAYAKALPAARDTILVIDMSTSMDDLGGDQPVTDVKEAGIAFVDQVLALDSESVDRIGVVSFDRYGNNRISLTSQNDSANFEAVKGAIMDMPLYGGGGWNTNFQAGMQVAMDEMLANGRQNAKKTIVFMTDGYANLPGGDIDINTCYTKYYYGNYYANRGYWSYANYYYDQAQDCTEDYVENLLDMTNFEIARAVNNDVTVHTIQIGGENSNSLNLLRAMLRDEDWDSGLLDTMAFTTDGEQYAAATNDGDGITEIYQTIAKNIKMKLSS